MNKHCFLEIRKGPFKSSFLTFPKSANTGQMFKLKLKLQAVQGWASLLNGKYI